MIHGPDLAGQQEQAKSQVMQFFVDRAEADGTPATLRAMYVMKAAEAEKVLAGGASALIEGEAQLRGVAPEDLARMITSMAADSAELELARMRVNIQIEQASTEQEIMDVLDTIGVQFSMNVE